MRVHRASIGAFAFILLLGLFASACSKSGTRSSFALFMVRDPVEQASRRLSLAQDEAWRAVATPKDVQVALRYNPASCDCPAWEAFVFGRWERVALEPRPGAEHRAMTSALVSTTGRSTRSSQGWNYAVLTWRPAPSAPQTSP